LRQGSFLLKSSNARVYSDEVLLALAAGVIIPDAQVSVEAAPHSRQSISTGIPLEFALTDTTQPLPANAALLCNTN